MFRNRFKTSAIGFTISSALVLMLSLAMAAPAFADGGGTLTPNIGAGSLSVINYPTYNSGAPSITGTSLNGLDKTLTIEMPLTATDASGTGNGWTLYGDVQQFSVGTTPATFHTIPNNAITFASTVADSGSGASSTALGCDSQSTCSLPTTLTTSGTTLAVEDASLAGSGPYTVQYATGSYNGNVIAAASANHGMGKMNIEADFTVNLPANTTYAGTYSSVFAVTFANTPV